MKFLTFLILFLLSWKAYCQTVVFNKRIQLGCVNTILSGVEVTDSCYYVTGNARDSVTCNLSALFVKFDTLGNVLSHKILVDTLGTHETWQPSLRTNTDGNLVVSAYYSDLNGNVLGSLLKYTLGGDLIWTHLYDNPYIAGGFIRPDDMQIGNDSGYIVVSSVNDTFQGASNVGILKVNKVGNEEWHITRGGTNYVEHTPCVYVEKNSGFIIGYQQDNLSGVQMNYTVRSLIEKVDDSGGIVWTYQSPNNKQVYGVNDLIKTKDDGWVAASALGYEKLAGTGTWSLFLHDCYLYKLDSARNFLWERVFPSGVDDRAAFMKVIELEDSSLVAFGTRSRWNSSLGDWVQHGRIVKVSPHGDSLWNREYEYLTGGTGIEHEVYDAASTVDGGFLVCGEAKGMGAGPYQQGWLLKLDKHGCLVPGCHIMSGVLPLNATNQMEISLFPNPTTDYLNIHYKNTQSQQDLEFSVLDIQGRVLQSYTRSEVSDKTYIFPVYNFPSGLYILEIKQDGNVITSKQFIKQ